MIFTIKYSYLKKNRSELPTSEKTHLSLSAYEFSCQHLAEKIGFAEPAAGIRVAQDIGTDLVEVVAPVAVDFAWGNIYAQQKNDD